MECADQVKNMNDFQEEKIMEEIEIKVLNEQEDDVEIKPKTGFACGWGCTAGAVCIGGILCP